MIYMLIVLIHSLVYVLVTLTYTCTCKFITSDYIIINSVPNLSEQVMNISRMLNAIVLDGNIVTYNMLALGKIQCKTLILIAHGCKGALSLSNKATLENLIVNGPLGLIGVLTTMYIPDRNESYLALKGLYFKMFFTPKAEEIIVVSCEVENLINILREKGYRVKYYTTLQDMVNDIIRACGNTKPLTL